MRGLHHIEVREKTDTGSGIETHRTLTDERIDWSIGESFTSMYYREYELVGGMEGGIIITGLTRSGETSWERWEEYDEWEGGNYVDWESNVHIQSRRVRLDAPVFCVATLIAKRFR